MDISGSSDTDGGDGRSSDPASAGDRRWGPLLGGSVLVLAVLWAGLTAWSGYVGSHPIGWITLVVGLALGGGMLAWAFLAPERPRRSALVRWAIRIGVGLVVVALGSVIVYTRPFPAESVAIDALVSDDDVTIEQSATRIVMQPTDARATGLAYYPGARVDPRATARILRPLAEAGFPVVVYKHPYNLAVLGIGTASDRIGDPDDGVDRWVIGGHSLGGAMAASYAETERDELVGLLFHAAFPVNDMSDRDLLVASVSGTNDGLADVDDIADSVADLPPDTTFTAVEGAVHAHFADYGPQRGDGEPDISREDAQAQIVAATLDLLEQADAVDQ